LALENDFLSGALSKSRTAERKAMIDRRHDLPLGRQAELLKLSRRSIYYAAQPVPPAELAIMRVVSHVRRIGPIYGCRMATAPAAVHEYYAKALIVPEQRGRSQFAVRRRDTVRDDVALVRALRAADIAAKPLSAFYHGPPHGGFLLGIAMATDAKIATLRMREVLAVK
jgi:DNA-binding transcriptional MocR family regulator